MRRSGITRYAPPWFRLVILICLLVGAGALRAATFTIGNQAIDLTDVSSRAEVQFRGMRFNRVQGVWNADLVVINRGKDPLPVPLVVAVESWTGTSGPVATDQTAGAAAEGPFWNLTAQISATSLAPAVSTTPRTITLARTEGQSPRLVTRVFARVPAAPESLTLAWTRVQDEAGLPVGDARVLERGPAGERLVVADFEAGIVSLGGSAGEYTWRFDAPTPTHLPVWIRGTLVGAETPSVQPLPTPRVTRRSAERVVVANGAATVASMDGTIELRIAAGTFAGVGTLVLTPMTFQALPLALPGGWSPGAAFWLETTVDPSKPIVARIAPATALPAGLKVAWVRLEELVPEWRVERVETVTKGGNLLLPCRGSGAYVLVWADVGEGTEVPPLPVEGGALVGVEVPRLDPAVLAVAGRALPPVSLASTNALQVTARAQVTARRGDGPVASGTRLRCEVEESYRMQDGAVRTLPRYETFVTLFREPGSTNVSEARAEFPLRPQVLLGDDTLEEATVAVDVRTPGEFEGGVLRPGARLELAGVTLAAADGVLETPQAVRWRALGPVDGAVDRFEIECSGLRPGRGLDFEWKPALPDGQYVLVREAATRGVFGLVPVVRFAMKAGTVTNHERGAVTPLTGLDRPGRYRVVRVDALQGVAEGTVRLSTGAGGAGASGLAVEVAGQLWRVFSDEAGRFRTLAPVGAGVLVVAGNGVGETAGGAFTMPESLNLASLDLVLGAGAPRVSTVTPGENAAGVPLLASVAVTFTRPLREGVSAERALQLQVENGDPVPARVRYDSGMTGIRLYPSNQLSELTRYSIVLAPELADATGTRLAGPTSFRFTTLTNIPVQRIGAQLLYSEAPGSNGMSRVIGTAGMAQPRQPVLFVNDTTGQTATLDANADGSFTNSMPAAETDRLRIVLVNTDGSRTEIPVGQQRFPDGSVALYSGGGSFVVRGTNSEIREAVVDVPPGATLGRTKLTLTLRPLSELAAVSHGVPPADGEPVGLCRLVVQGDPLRVPARLTFRFDAAALEAQLGKAPGTNDPILVAAVPRLVEQSTDDGPTNILAYDYLGSLQPDETGSGGAANRGRSAAPASPRPQSIIASWILEAGSTGVLDPVLFGVRLWPKFEITGRTVSAVLTNGVNLVPGTDVPLAGAVVRGRSSAQFNPRPFSLQPGELFTTSDGNGVFRMLAPTLYASGAPTPLLQGFSLNATHPAFPRQFAANSTPNLINPAHPFGVGLLAFDRTRPPDTTPPSISISHQPVAPEAGEPVFLRVESSDESGPTTDIVSLDGYTPASANVHFSLTGNGLWRLDCDRKAKVTFKISSTDPNGNRSERVYAVTYGLPLPRGPLANDPFGPWVSFSQPDENSVGVPTASAVTLLFSELVDGDIVANPSTYLTVRPAAGVPRAEFGRDHREVIVSFPSMQPDTTYSLTVQNVRDRNGQILDQDPDPASPAAEPFIVNFRTAPELHTSLTGIGSGGGVAMRGAVAYVLDRGDPGPNRILDAGSYVTSYDLSVPTSPVRLAKRLLPGPARSLAYIPDYSFALDFATPGQPTPEPPPDIVRGDLLAVAGKLPGGGYLRVFNLSDTNLNAGAIGSTVFNLDETALITRLAWSAPYLVAVENSASAPALRVFNLQSTLLGDAYRRMDDRQLQSLPRQSQPGRDANNDGDFVDAGDELPLLGRDAVQFSAGEVDLLTLAPNLIGDNQDFLLLSDTTRFIADAVVDGLSGFVGALVTGGRDVLVELNANSGPVRTNVVQRPASFRGLAVRQSLPEQNRVDFPDYYPKRALLVQQGVLRLAVLNLIKIDNSENLIALVECSHPDAIGLAGRIELPRADFGLIQGAELDGLGHIVVSTVLDSGIENFVILDISRLLSPAQPNVLHPAILGSVPGAGGGNTPFVTRPSGLNVVSLGRRNEVTQTSPRIQFIPADETWADPFTATDMDDRVADFRGSKSLELLPIAFHGTNSTLVPGEAAAHFQVMADLPGGAGRQISLSGFCLDSRNRVIVRPNGVQPPSILVDLPLRRLSDDPTHDGYNLYLSRPLALVAQDLESGVLGRAQSAHARHILFVGDRFRVGIPETLGSNPVLGPFAGSGDVARAGETNRPPVRLGVSVARPVLNLRPQLEADDLLKLSTTIDWVNNVSCPGHVQLHFAHNLDCRITLTIDGRPVRVVNDDQGNLVPEITDVASGAGAHWFLLDAAHVGAPGTHRFELVARGFAGLPPDVTLVETGTIEHEVEIHHAYPIGHTIIQGVDIWDGHLSHSEQDVMIQGRRLNLEFARSYSSSGNNTAGPLGPGWTHNLHVRLVRDDCGRWTVIGGDGSGNAFRNPRPDAGLAQLYQRLLPPVSAGGRFEFFQPQIGYHSTLVRDTAKPTDAWFFTKSGVRHHFVVEGKLSTPQNTVYTLREIREPHGNTLRFDYLDNDTDPATLDTVTEIDPLGGLPKRGFRFVYQTIAAEPRVTEMLGFNHQGSADLLGLKLSFGYDPDGNLIGCTRTEPDGSVRTSTYSYTPGANGPFAHNLLSVTTPSGHVTRYEYFPAGVAGYYAAGQPIDGIASHEVVKTVTRVGAAHGVFEATSDAVTKFTYDWAGFIRSVSDPRATDGLGQAIPDTVYTLNTYGATTRIVAPLGQVTEMRWATDHLDGTVTDAAGNPVHDVLMTYKKDAEGQEQFFEFRDGRGNPTGGRILPAPGRAPVLNAQGLAVAAIVTSAGFDPLFNNRTNSVDAEGHATVYEIDPATGDTLKVTDAEGFFTRDSYFPNGDLRERIDARGFTTRHLRYNIHGNVEVIRTEVERGGRTVETVNTYDERSRLRETRDTFLHHTTTEYDGLDRVILQRRWNDLSSGAQPSGGTVNPDSISHTRYHPGGEVTHTISPLGLTNRITYDALGRRIRSEQLAVLQADGSSTNYVTTQRYDTAGNLVAETDARGVTRTHRHDALHRRIQTDITGPFGPDQTVARAAYDRVGNVTNSIDLHGLSTTVELDGLHRVVATHLPFPGAVVRTTFDQVGTRRATTDALGNTSVLEYDRIYRLTRATDPEGNVVTYRYDEAGHPILETHLSSGLVVDMEYDGLGRMTYNRRKGPGLPAAGYETRTEFVDALNQAVTTNPRGFRSVVRKDGLDRTLWSIVDEGGLNLRSEFTCDAAGNVRSVADPEPGDVDVRRDYDPLGRVIRSRYVQTPDDRGAPVFEETTYDGGGNVVGRRDRRGIESRFTFDNLWRPRTSELSESISNAGAWLKVSEIEYDDMVRKVRQHDALGRQTTIQNDTLGRPESVEDHLRQQSHATYDALNKRTETDRRGLQRAMTYDRLNRLRTTTEFDTNGVARTRVETIYRDNQRQVLNVDRRGLTNIVHMDALGRVVRTDRSGGDTAVRYGSDPLPIETRGYDGNNNVVLVTDARGNQVKQEYDGADRMEKRFEGFGSLIEAATTFRYDRVGNLLESKDARVHGGTFDIQNTFDARYRKVAAANALGQTNRYTNDPVNNVIAVVEPLGGVTRYEFDELNKLLSVDETQRDSGTGDAGITRFRYDAVRNRIAQQDAVGNLVTYAYDALNRQTQMVQHLVVAPAINPRSHDPVPPPGATLVWTYGYDPVGNQTFIRDPRTQEVRSDYDHLNRLAFRAYTNHAELSPAGMPRDFQVLSLSFGYDGNGNPTNSVETKQLGAGVIIETTMAAFDTLDRLITKTRVDFDNPGGKTLAFVYDAVGNRTSITDADGRVTTFAFDERNRVSTATLDPAAGPLVAAYEWEPDSLLKHVSLPGGAFSDRVYDAADRLLRITNGGPAGTFSGYTYSYDANGNRTNQVELLPLLAAAAESTDYRFDRLNRLTNVVYGTAGALSYTYAPNGNRLTESGINPIGGGSVNRSYAYGTRPGKAGTTFDGVNTLTHIEDLTAAADHIDYEYDVNLNQAARIQGGVTNRFRFDIRDQMIAAEMPLGVVRFDYNADRLRVKKLSSLDPPPAFPETRYLYDQQAVLMEYGGLATAHATQHKYDYALDLLALGTPGPAPAGMTRDFYLHDGLGSTANLVTSAAAHTKTYRYDAWGRLRADSGVSDNRRQYTGHYRDAETGLHYFGARYYDEEQARFTSQDPYLGEAGTPPSLHRYLYAFANPVRYVDLNGYENTAANVVKGAVVDAASNAVQPFVQPFMQAGDGAKVLWNLLPADERHLLEISTMAMAAGITAGWLNVIPGMDPGQDLMPKLYNRDKTYEPGIDRMVVDASLTVGYDLGFLSSIVGPVFAKGSSATPKAGISPTVIAENPASAGTAVTKVPKGTVVTEVSQSAAAEALNGRAGLPEVSASEVTTVVRPAADASPAAIRRALEGPAGLPDPVTSSGGTTQIDTTAIGRTLGAAEVPTAVAMIPPIRVQQSDPPTESMTLPEPITESVSLADRLAGQGFVRGDGAILPLLDTTQINRVAGSLSRNTGLPVISEAQVSSLGPNQTLYTVSHGSPAAVCYKSGRLSGTQYGELIRDLGFQGRGVVDISCNSGCGTRLESAAAAAGKPVTGASGYVGVKAGVPRVTAVKDGAKQQPGVGWRTVDPPQEK